MRVAPLLARHLASAGGRQQAAFGVGRQLREEARDVGRVTGKARGRRHRVGRIIAGNDKAPSHGEAKRVTARERGRLEKWHVGFGLAQAGGCHDLALDPAAIRLARDRLDHEAKQAKAMVRIFEARVGRNRRRRPQLGHQLPLAQIRPTVAELAGVSAVAGEAGAVRQQLRDRGLRDLRMQPLDVKPCGIVEPQFALLAQLHDSGRRKTLGMRRDPEPVARRELFAGRKIGLAEGEFRNDLAAMGDGRDAAGLEVCVLDPVRIGDSGPLRFWLRGPVSSQAVLIAAAPLSRARNSTIRLPERGASPVASRSRSLIIPRPSCLTAKSFSRAEGP